MASSNFFPFGQYRRSSTQSYISKGYIDDDNIHEYENSPSGSISDGGIVFTDQILTFPSAIAVGQYYLLRVQIERIPSQQIFNLYLQNTSYSDDINKTSQYIGKYIVPSQLQQGGRSVIQLVLNSTSIQYNYLVFELERTIKDDYNYQEDGNDSQIGRIAKIHPTFFGRFNNIIKDNRTLTKIGIQATPGMLFCINGEGIRVGPSGMYEINNGYQINFISAAVGIKTDEDITSENTYDYEYFTIDYRYKQEEV